MTTLEELKEKHYLTRGEVIRLMKKVYPYTSANTVNGYISKGYLRPTKIERRGKYQHIVMFSDEYVAEVLKCVKDITIIDWNEVKKIDPDKLLRMEIKKLEREKNESTEHTEQV